MLKLQNRPQQMLFVIIAQFFIQSAAYPNQEAGGDNCLLGAVACADDTVTVGEIRSMCQQAPDDEKTSKVPPKEASYAGGVTRRIEVEAGMIERPFVLTAHRSNYVLPYTYKSHPNARAFELINLTKSIDPVETQFQASFKFPLAQAFLPSRLGSNNDLFLGFTTRAWWQSHNSDLSSPFRETDYEPQLFVRHHGGPSFGRLKIAGWDLGVAHQTNGQSKPLSRSWNRINGNLTLGARNIALAFRTWYRLPEDDDKDDNPDLHHFSDHGDVRLLYSRRVTTRPLDLQRAPSESQSADYALYWPWFAGSWISGNRPAHTRYS